MDQILEEPLRGLRHAPLAWRHPLLRRLLHPGTNVTKLFTAAIDERPKKQEGLFPASLSSKE